MAQTLTDSTNLPQHTVTYTRGLDLSGNSSVAGLHLRHEPDAGGAGGLLARTASNSSVAPLTAFYHADGNGNITCLMDSYQRLVAQYCYDSFGNMISKRGPFADCNLYRFSSKEFHPNSSLIYYLCRYYSSVLQRFVNRDPSMELGGINLYTFANNDPTDQYDDNGFGAHHASQGNSTGNPLPPVVTGPTIPGPGFPGGYPPGIPPAVFFPPSDPSGDGGFDEPLYAAGRPHGFEDAGVTGGGNMPCISPNPYVSSGGNDNAKRGAPTPFHFHGPGKW